jgi:hypothetical protein
MYHSCLCCHSFLWYYVVFLSGSESVQVFFNRLFTYMYLHWRSIYQERRVGTPLTGLVCHIFVPVSSQDLDFQHHMSWSFLCSVRMRGDCSFCWYWWNWWPSMFLFIIHHLNTHILIGFISAMQRVIRLRVFTTLLIVNYYQIYEKQMPHFKVVSMQLYIIYDKSHHWITAQVSDTNKTATLLLKYY